MLDPDSGKVTEYDLPLVQQPGDLWPDAEGNIWVENAVYNSLVKFEPATKKWTYYPFPDWRARPSWIAIRRQLLVRARPPVRPRLASLEGKRAAGRGCYSVMRVAPQFTIVNLQL